MRRTIDFFLRPDPRIPAFLIPCIFFLGFSLIYNEEQYFGYAKAFMDPGWMKDSFSFSDFPGSRILFQWPAGFLLRFISFGQLAFWGRLVSFLLLSFPLAALARHYRLNTIVFSFFLIALYLPQQSFFGGEWIYGGFESKVFAYVLILWSLVFLLKGKYFPAILLACLSVYWHILSGGWYCIYLFLYLLPRMVKEWKILGWWVFSGVLVLPLLYYMYRGIFSGAPGIIDGVNISAIYANVRNPQHIGIFRDARYFFSYHSGKIAVSALALVLSVTVYGKHLPLKYRELNGLLIIILIQNLLFVIVAYFDRNGTLMKTYPFRGSVLAMLLFQFESLVLIQKKVIPAFIKTYPQFSSIKGKIKIFRYQLFFLLGIIFLSAALKTAGRIGKYRQDEENRRDVVVISNSIRANSSPGDSFLSLCPENSFVLSIPRRAERDCYFMFRFIPTQNQSIYEWNRRRLMVKGISDDPATLGDLRNSLGTKLLLSQQELNLSFLEPVSKAGNYHLYRIR
jgi:hypothetical protein